MSDRHCVAYCSLRRILWNYWLLGQARFWGMPFKMFGTGPFLGQAFKMRGTGLLLGQALLNSWYRSALGTGPPKCLGQAHSWDMPSEIRTCDRLALGTGPTLTVSLRFGMVCDVTLDYQ